MSAPTTSTKRLEQIGIEEHRGMKRYIVSLFEEPGDEFLTMFECQADSEDHAEEQAMSAYPSGEIQNITVME